MNKRNPTSAYRRASSALAAMGLISSISSGALADQSAAPTRATLPVRGGQSSAQGVGVGLTDAIRAYARHMGLAGVFIDPNVPNRRIRFFVRNLDDATIFDELLRTNGLASLEVDGVLHVAAPDVLAVQYGGNMTRIIVRRGIASLYIPVLRAATHERVAFIANDSEHALYAIGPDDAVNTARSLVARDIGGRTEIIRFKHGLDTAEASAQLNALIDDSSGSIRAIPAQNGVAVTGSNDYIERARIAVAKIDVAPAQVFYTASIIEITPRSENIQRGITLGPIVAGRSSSQGSSSGGGAMNLTGGALPIGQVSASLDALVSRGEARILKRLTITTTSGTTASNAFDNQIPIVVNDAFGIATVRTVNAGVGIEIMPLVGTDSVTTQIKTTYTEVTGYSSNGYPNLAERTSTNNVSTGKDQTILISGLYSDESLSTRTSSPPFSYIPVVGGVFKHRSETSGHNEVIIVVTPTISDGTTTGPAFNFPSIPDALKRDGIAPASAATPHP